jgi:hypothetical protein
VGSKLNREPEETKIKRHVVPVDGKTQAKLV